MKSIRHRPRQDGWDNECDREVALIFAAQGLDPEADLSGADATTLLAELERVRTATCVADCSLDVLYQRRFDLWTALEAAGTPRSEMAARSGVDRNVVDQAFSAARRKAARE